MLGDCAKEEKEQVVGGDHRAGNIAEENVLQVLQVLHEDR